MSAVLTNNKIVLFSGFFAWRDSENIDDLFPWGIGENDFI